MFTLSGILMALVGFGLIVYGVSFSLVGFYVAGLALALTGVIAWAAGSAGWSPHRHSIHAYGHRAGPLSGRG